MLAAVAAPFAGLLEPSVAAPLGPIVGIFGAACAAGPWRRRRP